jgi:hypothetical protein
VGIAEGEGRERKRKVTLLEGISPAAWTLLGEGGFENLLVFLSAATAMGGAAGSPETDLEQPAISRGATLRLRAHRTLMGAQFSGICIPSYAPAAVASPAWR